MRDPYTDAVEQGMQVRLPKSNELFIDIDSEEDHTHLWAMICVLSSNGIHLKVTENRPSRTQGHRHIVAELDHELTPLERILLQAVLGSDRKRELLSWIRIHAATGFEPTVFFEKRRASSTTDLAA